MNDSRHIEIIDPSKVEQRINVIGCGATGSWVALILAKMGFKNLHFWDFDTVEAHNLPNQAFTVHDIDALKVDALTEWIGNNVDLPPGSSLTPHPTKVDGETKLQGIVFLLTDTMSSRSDIFKKALKNNMAIPVVIETRMGTESGRVYTVNPCDAGQVRKYEATLYKDEEATKSVCKIAQTLAPTAMGIASKAVWQFIQWVNKEDVCNEVILDFKNDVILSTKY